MKKILIVDDDVHIVTMVREMLRRKGYGVSCAYSGTEAIYALARQKPDLVLLDLMLPGMSGEEVLPHLKGIPVIVISGRAGVDDKVALLLGGAVDYVTKPFHLEELAARIEAHLRTDGAAKPDPVLRFGELILDTGRYTLTAMGEKIPLTRTEYAILKNLMENPDRVVTKLRLLDCIAEDTPDCTDESLRVHISHLRTKLRRISGRDYVESVWGIGYKMKKQES